MRKNDHPFGGIQVRQQKAGKPNTAEHV